jgi:hypothetical protein
LKVIFENLFFLKHFPDCEKNPYVHSWFSGPFYGWQSEGGKLVYFFPEREDICTRYFRAKKRRERDENMIKGDSEFCTENINVCMRER